MRAARTPEEWSCPGANSRPSLLRVTRGGPPGRTGSTPGSSSPAAVGRRSLLPRHGPWERSGIRRPRGHRRPRPLSRSLASLSLSAWTWGAAGNGAGEAGAGPWESALFSSAPPAAALAAAPGQQEAAAQCGPSWRAAGEKTGAQRGLRKTGTGTLKTLQRDPKWALL